MTYFEYPDTERCIAAISNSVLQNYHIETENPTYPPLDVRLTKDPRNIVLLMPDGLGQNILTFHLPEDSFLRRHQTDTLSSVFPPTTTAAATAIETGMYPSQSDWLGWNIFWPPLGENVALYPNTTEDGKNVRKQLEVDFVVNHGDRKLYIQSAFQMGTEQKESAELDSLKLTGDFFKKIIVRMDIPHNFYDDNGIFHCNLIDFLLERIELF